MLKKGKKRSAHYFRHFTQRNRHKATRNKLPPIRPSIAIAPPSPPLPPHHSRPPYLPPLPSPPLSPHSLTHAPSSAFNPPTTTTTTNTTSPPPSSDFFQAAHTTTTTTAQSLQQESRTAFLPVASSAPLVSHSHRRSSSSLSFILVFLSSTWLRAPPIFGHTIPSALLLLHIPRLR